MKNLLQGQTNEVFYQAKILLDLWLENPQAVREKSLNEVFSQSLWLQLEKCYRALLAEYAGLYQLQAVTNAKDLINQLEVKALPLTLAERFLEQEEIGLVATIRQQLDARLSNTSITLSIIEAPVQIDLPDILEEGLQTLRAWVEELRLYSREE